jgi:phosphatidylglycerophosphatase A
MSVTINIWRSPVHVLAFGFGSGLSPWAPGTCGTVVAAILYLLFPPMHWAVYLLMILLTFVVGIWLCGKTSEDLGVHDHGGIVWDEFVGYWLTMFMAPAGWEWVLGGFLVFRLLDILKPWPIKWFDSQIKGGLGIMVDDVIAGIIGALCLQAVALLMAS